MCVPLCKKIFFSFTVCGRSRSNIMARIVGGRRSHLLKWPWMVSKISIPNEKHT